MKERILGWIADGLGFLTIAALSSAMGYGVVMAVIEGQIEAERIGREASARNPIRMESREIVIDGDSAYFTVDRRGER